MASRKTGLTSYPLIIYLTDLKNIKYLLLFTVIFVYGEIDTEQRPEIQLPHIKPKARKTVQFYDLRLRALAIGTHMTLEQRPDIQSPCTEAEFMNG